MFRSIGDFTQSWKFESEATLKVFRALTDASLSQRLSGDTRTPGSLAWHITSTLGEMLGHAGLPVGGIEAGQSPVPTTASAIVSAYEAGARAVGEIVAAHWSDSQLEEDVPMYGEPWKKGFILTALVAHQTHHRGQLTVLMRQAGLVIPGVYGPAREEWAAFGMAAPPE